MNCETFTRFKQTLFTFYFCVSLIACDGGIFGTGDGSTDSTVVSGVEASDAPDETQSQAVEADAQTVDASVNLLISVDDFSAARDVSVSVDGNLTFTNQFVLPDNTATELLIINTSSNNAAVFTGTVPSAEPLTLSPAGTVGEPVRLPADTDALFIDVLSNNNVRTASVAINPISIVSNSKTLLILRRTQPNPNLIAVPLIGVASNETTVSVRIVSSGLIGDPEVPSMFSLQPVTDGATDDSLNNQAAVLFDRVNDAQPVTNFVSVLPGNYLLSDDAGRYSNVPIELTTSGSVATVVLDPSLPSQSITVMD